MKFSSPKSCFDEDDPFNKGFSLPHTRALSQPQQLFYTTLNINKTQSGPDPPSVTAFTGVLTFDLQNSARMNLHTP